MKGRLGNGLGRGLALRLLSPHPQLRSGERIKLIPLLCIVCTSVVWGFALFFFFQGLSTWQVSSDPAETVGNVHFSTMVLHSSLLT